MAKQARYVDGFVLVVPKKNIKAYKEMAKGGAELWMRLGALSYKECMADDLNVKGMGGMPAPMSFLKLARPKKNEVVWFSYIEYRSRAHRDAVNKKMIKEMGKIGEAGQSMEMPFDVKRMAYGGFTVEVSD